MGASLAGVRVGDCATWGVAVGPVGDAHGRLRYQTGASRSRTGWQQTLSPDLRIGRRMGGMGPLLISAAVSRISSRRVEDRGNHSNFCSRAASFFASSVLDCSIWRIRPNVRMISMLTCTARGLRGTLESIALPALLSADVRAFNCRKGESL